MSARSQTIALRVSKYEYSLIDGLARLRGMTTSDVVRELIGFEHEDKQSARGVRHLRLVPTKSERGGGRGASACLPSR